MQSAATSSSLLCKWASNSGPAIHEFLHLCWLPSSLITELPISAMYAPFFQLSFFSSFSSDKAAYTLFPPSKMATLASTFTLPHHPSPFPASRQSNLSFPSSNVPNPVNFPIPNPSSIKRLQIQRSVRAQAAPTDLGLVQRVVQLVLTSPPTWQSAVGSNLIIFVLGSPLLVSGLSLSGTASAFLLATLTWRAFWIPGFLLAAMYFILVSPKPILSSYKK